MESALKQYERLATTGRAGYLRRARTSARYTIPYMMPPEGFNGTSDLPTPYQGLGQRGVRNLASKLLLTVLPPNQPFIKLGFTAKMEQEVQGSEGEFDEAFGRIERTVSEDLEGTPIRVRMFETLMQLIISGNVLLEFTDDGSFNVHKLNEFVTRRSPGGLSATTILKKRVLPVDLSLETIATCQVVQADAEKRVTEDGKVDVYTYITRDRTGWNYHQEINEIQVPGSDGRDPLDSPTFLALRMVAIDGEDYGRSYVEELLGDLVSYDGISQHILEGAAAMAKLLLLRKPNAVLRAKDLMLPNLSVVTGNVDDVAALQMDKSADFSVALSQANSLKERLEHSFLLTTAIQRNAERVTAEEIRTMAQELEDALGGVYSTLSHEIQLPLAKRQLLRLQREQRLPKELTDKDVIRMTITTGLAALGRGQDLQRLRGFLNDLATFSKAAEGLPEIARGEVIKRLGAAWGIENKDLVRSQEEVQAEQQQAQEQAQMMQMAQAAMSSGAATQLTKAATEGDNQG